jgi:hypothetical protein
MRTAHTERTPCEVIRKINDHFQGNSTLDKEVRLLCAEAEKGTKRIAQELNKYKKNAWAGWWKENKEFKKDVDNRLRDGYKQEGSRKI